MRGYPERTLATRAKWLLDTRNDAEVSATEWAEEMEAVLKELANAPAPSVPDEQLQAAFDRGLKAGNEQSVAQQIEIHKLHDSLAAPQPEPLSDERIFDLIGEYKALGGASGKEARLVNLARAIEREILGEKA